MTPARSTQILACNEGLFEVHMAAPPCRRRTASPHTNRTRHRPRWRQPVHVDQQEGLHRIGRFRLGHASCPCDARGTGEISAHGLSGRFVLSMHCGLPHAKH